MVRGLGFRELPYFSYGMLRPDLDCRGSDNVASTFVGKSLLPIPWMEPWNISNAVVWLSSDQARFVTGVTLPVDAGNVPSG